ncbi:helix-turn-helix domain-containing protein [Paraliomyxa miuraensis]|uniref:helix-turn-helix domain-containing protein n=1 Tax=Paraliomyxa miuraensis TaxID=376150 RepID=UPI00225B392D|nr:helix-turn-helix domain-containing protein [Paraliomyxa miuraensis]MCX4240136.1 hypothetical protein [Paraliomyxa miuraensis]
MTTARRHPSSPNVQGEIVIDLRKMVRLVEGMKVWELAQFAGTTVEAVVSRVVIAGNLPGVPEIRNRNVAPRRRGPEEKVAATVEASKESEPEPEVAREPEPELGRFLGRATRRELKVIVDRWVLGRVLVACEWNITHAANRLEVSRRMLRQRWAAVRRPAVGALMARLASSEPVRGILAGPSLAELLERRATHREIHREIDRWVVRITLAAEGGNVTQAAKNLGTTRRALRGIRDSKAQGS